MSYRYQPSRQPISTDALDYDAPLYAATPPGTRTPNDRLSRSHGGSRKSSETVNLNHLLNFSLPARNAGVSGSSVPRRSRGVRRENGAYLREKYVNSQFRFVMKPTGNYNAHLADPDVFFNWSSVLQVLVPTMSALSLAQGDEPSSLLPSSASYTGLASGTVDPERKMRKEKEREGMSCPICLGPPVAGRMTKCGHIFCFPCILHYFQLSDIPKCAKCPICGDTIEDRMLKSVRWWDGDAEHHLSLAPAAAGPSSAVEGPAAAASEHHDHGSDVMGHFEVDSAFAGVGTAGAHRLRMRLMQRPHISTLALPRSSTWPSDAIPAQSQAPFHFLPDVMSFSKFCLATTEYMTTELERDLAELAIEKRNMVTTGDELGATFVDSAVRKCREQLQKAKDEMDVPTIRKSERERKAAVKEVERAREARAQEDQRRSEKIQAAQQQKEDAVDTAEEPPAMHLAMTGQAAYVADTSTEATPRPAEPPSLPPVPSQPHKKGQRRSAPQVALGLASADEPAYLFYQSATGAYIFLHPLDIKILLSHYGGYASFPNSLLVRPEGSDEGTINEELRKRCKYLSHLPLGTDVVFVEADLEDTLGAAAVAPFEQALKQRRNRRREKVRKEDRAKSRWEAKEREKLPPGMRGTSDAVFTGEADSEEFLMALERSTLEAGAYPAMNGSLPSTATTSFLSSDAASFPPSTLSSNRLSPNGVDGQTPTGLSPPGVRLDGVWGSGVASNGQGLRTTSGMSIVRPVKKTEEDLEMDNVWNAFQESAATSQASVDSKGSGKKSKKKVVLNMSSGGRRA